MQGISGFRINSVDPGKGFPHFAHTAADTGEGFQNTVCLLAVFFQKSPAFIRQAIQLAVALLCDGGVADFFQIGEGRVDHAGAGGIEATGFFFQQADQFVTMCRLFSQQGKQDELEFFRAEFTAFWEVPSAGASSKTPSKTAAKAPASAVALAARSGGVVRMTEGTIVFLCFHHVLRYKYLKIDFKTYFSIYCEKCIRPLRGWWLDLPRTLPHHLKMCSISGFYKVGVAGVGLMACLLSTPVFAAEGGENQPSKAEMASINRQIAAIQNPQDRAAVQNQSLVWKVTTFLCQNAARAPLTHLGSDDRFFLQDDQPDSQVLVSSSLVQGRGQFRQAADGISWTPFQWSCHLDPATGSVKSFEATPLAGAGAVGASVSTTGHAPTACQVRNLHVTLDDRNGAFDGMSQSGTVLTVRNTGAEACTLPPVPLVQFEDGRGHRLSVFRRSAVRARQPGPHGAKVTQHVVPVLLEPGAVREATLHWVSGEVFDDSHNCVQPPWLVLKVGQGEQRAAFKGHLCAPAGAHQVFDQSALQAHTDAQ